MKVVVVVCAGRAGILKVGVAMRDDNGRYEG